ncbi:MAG: hypothetical protein U0264_13855 [Candidatus Kapaibacterium sp.]
MKFYRSLLALICSIALGLSACSPVEPEPEATLMTVSDLRTSTGYAWFDAEVNTYTPSAAKVKEISDAYQANHQQVYLFVNPSCGCNGTKKTFPQTIKVLQSAGVPDSMIIIYSMRSSQVKHPLMSRFSLRGLPSIFVTKNQSTVYVMQALNEKLYGNLPTQPDTEAGSRTVEEMLQEGFTK